MSAGRTMYVPKDAAWWRRSRIVELGQEHGPAGPAVMDWLTCEARTQGPIRGHDGSVKSGYAALTHGCFLRGGADEARAVVATAVELGLLDDFDDQGRTFTTRISGWTTDVETRLASDRRAAQRAAQATDGDEPTTTGPKATTGDREVTGAPVSPDVPPVSPDVPPEGEGEGENNDPPTPLPGGDGDQTRSRTALKPPAFKRKPVSPERARLAWQLVAEVNRVGQVDHEPLKADGSWSESASRVLGALDAYPVITLELGRRMIEIAAGRRWWQGPMHAKHVFAPAVVETLLQEARRPQLVQTGTTATGEPDRLPGETDTQRSNRLKAAGRARAAQRAAEHDAAEAGR